MKKVIYISYMRLSPRVEKDWFINDLVAKGAEVEFWDVTDLLFRGMISSSEFKPAYLRKIHTFDELHKYLKNEDTATTNFVAIVSQEARFYKFFRILQSYNLKLHFIHWGELPSSSAKSKYKKAFDTLAHPITFTRSVYYKLKTAAYTLLKLVKPFDVVFAAGDKALSMHKNVPEVVPINLIDYEKYVISKKHTGKMVEGAYAVFLDINLPYQSDLAVMRMLTINPERYYASLNNYFDQIEHEHNLKVVIAAHPSAKYDAEKFKGRLIFSSSTPELVKDSEFVISHHSTSLSFAVLNKKPILFVYTDEMLSAYKTSVMVHINNIANFLGATPINIDTELAENKLAVKRCNLALYEAYKYDYLTTHESEFLETKEIFTQLLLT